MIFKIEVNPLMYLTRLNQLKNGGRNSRARITQFVHGASSIEEGKVLYVKVTSVTMKHFCRRKFAKSAKQIITKPFGKYLMSYNYCMYL